MLITCKCLNVIVEGKESEGRNVELGYLKLSPVEELEGFFKEDIKEVEKIKVTKQIPSLTQGRSVGAWTVQHCLNCSINCYATNVNRPTALINASLITNTDAINHMRNHRDFSPVFRIIIQPVVEEKGFDLTSIRQKTDKVQNVLTSLQQQLQESIREEVAKTEEKIRSFNEQQYTQLEDFRNRATKDHRALARKIYEVQVPVENQEMSTSSTENENRRVDYMKTSFNHRLIGSKKSEPVSVARDMQSKGRPIPARSISGYSRLPEKVVAGSLDSEGLFVIEGMEENATNEPGHSEGESDTDHDDSGSHDEGIDVHRKRAPSFQLAKSLPVNVPVYSVTPSDFDHDDEPSDAVDIAASIKALARSVHGDTVFGDLPRPRFSTQI